MSDMRRMMMMFTRPEDALVPAPIISPDAGGILSSQAISISITGIAVYAEYSTDNENWATYSSPFTLANNATIYARATDGNGHYSNVVSNSYTILPYDAQVEYLESSGTQYIDTGINIQCSNAELNMRYSGFANKYFCCGCRKAYNNSAFVFSNGGTSTTKYTQYFINYGTTYKNPACPNDSSIHSVVFNNLCKVDGTTIATFTAANQTTPTTFWLFGSNNQDGAKYGSMRIYECKIYNNNSLSIDLIPVRVGQVGYMYDKVSGNLLGNDGSGSFTYGNDVTT